MHSDWCCSVGASSCAGSESCFKTVKYQLDYAGRFRDAAHARAWFTEFFGTPTATATPGSRSSRPRMSSSDASPSSPRHASVRSMPRSVHGAHSERFVGGRPHGAFHLPRLSSTRSTPARASQRCCRFPFFLGSLSPEHPCSSSAHRYRFARGSCALTRSGPTMSPKLPAPPIALTMPAPSATESACSMLVPPAPPPPGPEKSLETSAPAEQEALAS